MRDFQFCTPFSSNSTAFGSLNKDIFSFYVLHLKVLLYGLKSGPLEVHVSKKIAYGGFFSYLSTIAERCNYTQINKKTVLKSGRTIPT